MAPAVTSTLAETDAARHNNGEDGLPKTALFQVHRAVLCVAVWRRLGDACRRLRQRRFGWQTAGRAESSIGIR